MKSEFIKNLKRVMFEKGITQKELAKKLKTTQSFISAYQTGARNPKQETVEKIAKALGVSANVLIDNSENSSDFNKANNDTIDLRFQNLEKRLSFLEKEFMKLKNKK